jgi:hypothetical protein
MSRREDNVNTDIMKQVTGGVDWIHLTQDGGQQRPGLQSCDTAYTCRRIPKFRRNLLPPSSGSKLNVNSVRS